MVLAALDILIAQFMGHGMCDTFTKQAQLVASGGRATSDDKIIGEHAWRLLKSLNFDPKELRGIGIQIQKLEKTGALEVEPGQAVLPFKPADSPKKSTRDEKKPEERVDISLGVHPPSQLGPAPDVVQPEATSLDLPSFSQVDMSVFEALPDDLRQELEQEYKRRSATPAVQPKPPPSRPAPVFSPKKTKIKLFMPGIKPPNVKRITRQLAPKSSRSSLATAKSKIFSKQKGSPAVKVSIAELRRLDIDPTVFYILPVAVQREQLALMRQKHAPGGSGLAFGSQRKAIKANKIKGKPIAKRPPPKARYHTPPSLKQRGQASGEKLYFTEKDDVQRVIETWVDSFREHPPNQKDVDFFAKYLVQCVDGSRSSDSGIERAVAVAKWWMILLRRYFGAWEHAPEDAGVACVKPPYTSEAVGRAWWRAFREVKQKMDVVARKKFGGCLSLR